MKTTTFQFTLPRGERHPHAVTDLRDLGFNSRSRVGSDRRPPRQSAALDAVSIHAPAWGATSHGIAKLAYQLFQFTLPRGERP